MASYNGDLPSIDRPANAAAAQHLFDLNRSMMQSQVASFNTTLSALGKITQNNRQDLRQLAASSEGLETSKRSYATGQLGPRNPYSRPDGCNSIPKSTSGSSCQTGNGPRTEQLGALNPYSSFTTTDGRPTPASSTRPARPLDDNYPCTMYHSSASGSVSTATKRKRSRQRPNLEVTYPGKRSAEDSWNKIIKHPSTKYSTQHSAVVKTKFTVCPSQSPPHRPTPYGSDEVHDAQKSSHRN